MVIVQVKEGKMHRCNGKKYASDDPFEVTEQQYEAFQDKLKRVEAAAATSDEPAEEPQVDDTASGDSDAETTADADYPLKKPGGWWTFSDGTSERGLTQEEAEAKEAAIQGADS